MSPWELIALAKDRGLRAIGVADHDTTAGLRTLSAPSGADAIQRDGLAMGCPIARELDGAPLNLTFHDVEVVPAVELNSEWKGRELHILGYYIPLGPGPFQDLLADLQDSRRERIASTVERLTSLGMPVEETRVLELATGESVGRPHVAQAMLEKGYVTSIKDAFDRVLGIGRPGYVERFHLTPIQSVRAIREAGGVPVWAHPGASRALGLITALVDNGLLGVEASHPEHNANMRRKCLAMAEDYHLIATGGSDFHGPKSGEGGDLGSVVVPYDVVTRLKEVSGR